MVKTVAIMGTDGGVNFSAPGFDRAFAEVGQSKGGFIRADEIQADMSLRDIVEMTTFDAARFDQVRTVNTKAIRKLMAEAGCRLIPH